MGLQWVSVEARTGKIITDLPDLVATKAKVSLGRYEPCPVTLPLTTAPENWVRATKPGASVLLLLGDNPEDPAHGIPLTGLLVLQRPRTEKDELDLSTTTIEGYLDRRFVGDRSYVNVGQNAIIADLVTSFVAALGIPIRVQYVTSGAGKLRKRTYQDQDDKTVYSALSDLMGVRDGPEWTIGWEWQHNPERLTPVLYVGDRIGRTAPVGLNPSASFEIPGSVRSFKYLEDYSSRKGANSVVATSSGQGDTRPQSSPHVVADVDRPRFEFRWSPSSSITDTDTLDDYAAEGVKALAEGTNTIQMTADLDTAPQLGTDWALGDDVYYVIGGHDSTGADTVPSMPGGKEGVARAIGWEIDFSEPMTITPTLLLPGLDDTEEE
ncbi:hypothetical protein ACFJGV_15195 [Cnuibacter sp. UC19_7]|uniref:hypothetical protein n=1 Tax=Cnuibacter sp. UC19_7 TaxID=3350166 RepID=UPI00366AF539